MGLAVRQKVLTWSLWMHGSEVLRRDLLLDWLCAMSEDITELDLLRLLNTGISSLVPVTEVQPSLCPPWLGRSLSAYLASRMPSTPTRYATYGLQVARTLCNEMSEIVLITLMKTMTEMPWFSRATMSAPVARQANTTTAAEAKENSCSSVPCRRDHAAASPRWHNVKRKRAVWIRTPQRIKYRPTQKKAHTRENNSEIKCHQVCTSSPTQAETKWTEDPERLLSLLQLASVFQSANVTTRARKTESDPTHTAHRSLWELHILLRIRLNHDS